MKRLVLVFALLALVACVSESNFPNPTGKGTIRAINAIPASQQVGFRIEEMSGLLGNLFYRDASAGQRFDDFSYIFNFEVSFFGDITTTRIASPTLKVDANKDYTFVLTGDIASPTVTVWEGDERNWEGSETVFEVRFAHTAATLGDIDVYFAADGIVPAIGEERGTLSFGEILPPIDFEAADLVLSVTPAGDPSTILFQSSVNTYVAQSAMIIPFFDGDERDTGLLVARVINAQGNTVPIPDITALPTVRFIQTVIDLANADVYDDEMLTSLLLSDHAFGDVTNDIQFPTGTTNLTYTTVGDTSAILFDSGITAVAGLHFNFVVLGTQGSLVSQALIPDRQSISTLAKLRPYHAAQNHNSLDFYVVDAGIPLDEESPALRSIAYSLPSPTLGYVTGSYDMYVTLPGDKTIVAGPVQIDVVFGDVVEVFIFDTVDPATAEIRILPNQ